MRSRLALLACLVMIAAAEAPAGPVNMDFESVGADGGPAGWRPLAPSAPQGYRLVADTLHPYAGRRSARLGFAGPGEPPPGSFVATSQSVDATRFRGLRVRFRAAVRTDGPGRGLHGLWLRIDRQGGRPSLLYNMQDRPITGVVWAIYEIVMTAPPDADRIVFGALTAGTGRMWIDSASLDVAPGPPPDPTGASMSPQAKAYLDAALDLLQQRHINRLKADWPALRRRAYAVATGARAPRDTYDAIRETIGSLGERHSFFEPAPRSSGKALSPAAPAARPGAPTAPMPEGERLELSATAAVGVVRVPPLNSWNAAPELNVRYRDRLWSLLSGMDRQGVCGWVVDLRPNGGGNMWPMLNGLGPVLDEGPFGVFLPVNGQPTPWVRRGREIEIADMEADTGSSDAATPPSLRARGAPVAVLVGMGTGSSGEMTAIAFIGRPGVRMFGAPTAGLTTSNEPLRLSDGAGLILTSSYVGDRSGRRIDGPLQPDEKVDDAGIMAAAEAWLKSQGCG